MYDPNWTRNVVAAFEAKHRKGCLLVRDIYRLPTENIERLLLGNDERWRGYKALVKHLEQCLGLYEAAYKASKDFGSNYYTFVKYLRGNLKRRSFPAPLDLVDSEISSDYSLGAPKREDGPSEATSEGRQFLLF